MGDFAPNQATTASRSIPAPACGAPTKSGYATVIALVTTR